MTGLRAAEFFAGMGLMRLGLEQAGIQTVWANDVSKAKWELYRANFGDQEFVLGDVRDLSGADLPEVDLATASFPCTDLSLAGERRGLGTGPVPRGGGGQSSMFWEFARLLEEMGDRKPGMVLLENVLGFASSNGGRDLEAAVRELNRMEYSCDLFAVDARSFVPQSRPRMFIVGLLEPPADWAFTVLADRPRWVHGLAHDIPGALLHACPLPALPAPALSLDEVVERIPTSSPLWWDRERVERFEESLSVLQRERLLRLRESNRVRWRTAYRRTRGGRAVWEIRNDEIAGCLRTTRGGSSRQALVEVDGAAIRVRWMTAREGARLMGAPEFRLSEGENKALLGLGDAVCVPVIRWIAEHYLVPLHVVRRPQAVLR